MRCSRRTALCKQLLVTGLHSKACQLADRQQQSRGVRVLWQSARATMRGGAMRSRRMLLLPGCSMQRQLAARMLCVFNTRRGAAPCIAKQGPLAASNDDAIGIQQGLAPQASHEQLVYDSRVCSSPRALHDLAHKEPFQLLTASSKLLDLRARMLAVLEATEQPKSAPVLGFRRRSFERSPPVHWCPRFAISPWLRQVRADFRHLARA